MNHKKLPSNEQFMSLKSMIKGLLSLVVSGIALVGPLHANTAREYFDAPDAGAKVTEFAGAIDQYVAVVQTDGELTDEQKSTLESIATRAADIYFELSPDPANKTYSEQMIQFIQTQVSDNASKRARFLFLGNAFVAKAEAIIKNASSTQGRGRPGLKYTLLGAGAGALIGLGVSWVWKTPAAVLIGVAIAATGAGIGYSADRRNAPMVDLPVDRDIKNAQDFKAKYGTGEDVLGQAGAENLGAALPPSDEDLANTLASLE